ncbi:hypothetical protein T492DRAFT_881811 [Pavlovales sp. CCMP2436]|nr:hypothetical protein T492DRAFT_881811 [Pavlovales sp. CCMP2436]
MRRRARIDYVRVVAAFIVEPKYQRAFLDMEIDVQSAHKRSEDGLICIAKVGLLGCEQGATAAPARLKGDMTRSGSTPCKHQGRPQPSGTTSGRGAAEIRVEIVPAA